MLLHIKQVFFENILFNKIFFKIFLNNFITFAPLIFLKIL